MATISTTITQTVTLGSVDSYPTYASPLTIAASGEIATNTTESIYGPATQTCTVVNDGKVINNNSLGVAITLGLGGVIRVAMGSAPRPTGAFPRQTEIRCMKSRTVGRHLKISR